MPVIFVIKPTAFFRTRGLSAAKDSLLYLSLSLWLFLSRCFSLALSLFLSRSFSLSLSLSLFLSRSLSALPMGSWMGTGFVPNWSTIICTSCGKNIQWGSSITKKLIAGLDTALHTSAHSAIAHCCEKQATTCVIIALQENTLCGQRAFFTWALNESMPTAGQQHPSGGADKQLLRNSS